MKTLVMGVMMLLVAAAAQAQRSVNYEALGLSFNIPAGWAGEEGDGYYAIEGDGGRVVLISHEAQTRSELESGAHEGIQFSEDSMLQLNGVLSPFGESGIRADMIGIIEWTPVEAHAIALLSPHGKGVVVLSLAAHNQLDQEHREYGQTVASTVRFFKPIAPPVVQEWKDRFQGMQVTYAKTSGGTSDRSSFTLCGDRFSYYGSTSSHSQTDFYDGSSVSASALGSDSNSGAWSIESDGRGGATFVVRYDDGRVGRFDLERKDGKTYLNGTRYFVVSADC